MDEAVKNVIYARDSWVRAVGELTKCSSVANQLQGTDDVRRCLREVKTLNMGELLCTWYFEELKELLSQNYAPQFWAPFSQFEDEKRKGGKSFRLWASNTIQQVVGQMHKTYRWHEQVVMVVENELKPTKSMVCRLKDLYSSIIVLAAPDVFQEVLLGFFMHSFIVFRKNHDSKNNVDRMEGSEGDGLGEEEDYDSDDDALDDGVSGDEQKKLFRETCACLHDINMMTEPEEMCVEVLHRVIDRHVSQAKGEYLSPTLQGLTDWLSEVVWPWMELVFVGREGRQDPMVLGQWKTRLEFYVYERFGTLRIGEMFDMIVDYPDSLCAFEDLKECLGKTHQHPELISSLRLAFTKRLLHPGASTSLILTQYINTIKSLRVLDPTSVILESVDMPIKEYLRDRKDTVRCIVTLLLEDNNSELLEGASCNEKMAEGDEDSEGEDAETTRKWMPDPIDSDPSRSAKSRACDILTMLVNIYGSRELFVNEYRSMLADKLLACLDYDTDREIRNLELLKLRFGDASLRSCQIMLKDLADSKRINTNIHSLQKKKTASPEGYTVQGWDLFNSTIISRMFWPALHEEDVTLPPDMQQICDAYASIFHTIKTPRKIVWRKNLGSVELELKIGGKTLEVTVSPAHATIISKFTEKKEWTLNDLANATGLAKDSLRKKMFLWLDHGILAEVKRASELTYRLVEEYGSEDYTVDNLPSGADEGETMTSSGAQEAQEMAIYESFVTGMLTNFESLPLDRIHNMLKIFCTDPPFEKTTQELETFLSKLVSDFKLEFSAGMYSLRKT